MLGSDLRPQRFLPRRPTDTHSKHLFSVYRVGMLAMETMGRRIHDDRSYVKFSQNPPYGDDVIWLFGVAQKLGLPYAYQFCLAAAQSVVSPFVLYNLTTETMRLFPTATHSTANTPILPPLPNPNLGVTSNIGPPNNSCVSQRLKSAMAAIANSGYSPAATHLLQRCLQMFYIAAHQKLSHTRFLASDVEEVCNLVRTAKIAFNQHLPRVSYSPEALFQDYMQHMRRQKSCKKDVWAKISAVANPTPT